MMTHLMWPSVLESSSTPLPLHRADPTVCGITYLDSRQDLKYGAHAEDMPMWHFIASPWGLGIGNAMLWDGYSLPLPQPDLIYHLATHLELSAGSFLAKLGSTYLQQPAYLWSPRTLPLSSMAFHSFCWFPACYLIVPCRQNMVPGWRARAQAQAHHSHQRHEPKWTTKYSAGMG